MPAESVNYVDNSEGVQALAQMVSQAPRVALDTEADSLHHYYEKVCLLQISLNGRNYIVDPLSGPDLSPLMKALARRPLILHGADYDLRMLRRDFGFRASEVFDTMSAAQLLGYEQLGLAALVERHCGVQLCKHGQKADWSRRPLPEKLLRYAVDDTRYLEPLSDALRAELERMGRLEWHGEMCRRLLASAAAPDREPDPERQWRVKGWHSLKSRRALAILRSLWRWRDAEARRADLPPFKVMSNDALVALSAWAMTSTDYASAPKLPRTCVGRRLRTLKDAIARARQLPDEACPALTPPRGGQRRVAPDKLIAMLKKMRDEAAAQLGIAPGLLLPATAIEAIAKARPATMDELIAAGELHHWQAQSLGPRILAIVQPAAAGATEIIPEVPADSV